MYSNLVSKLERRKIPALDGVRGIAALIVVFYHLQVRHLSWLPDGAFGVLVFFVLSGFLITWLLLKEADDTGTVSLRSFYFRRSLRIFPAFYFCWIVTLGTLLLTHAPVPWRECVVTFFYSSDYYYPFHDNQSFMGYAWSLAVEEQFYLIWPFVFVVMRARRATLSKALVAVIIGCWIYRAALKFILHAPEHYISYAFDCHIDHLMVGALAAITLREGWLRGFWERMIHWQSAVLAIGVLAISITLQHRFGHTYDHTFGFILDPIMIAIVLIQLISFETSAPVSWLNLPVSRFIGTISYPLYLYHVYAIQQADRLFSRYGFKVTAAVSLMLAVALASGSFFFVERPFLGLKKRRACSKVKVVLSTSVA